MDSKKRYLILLVIVTCFLILGCETAPVETKSEPNDNTNFAEVEPVKEEDTKKQTVVAVALKYGNDSFSKGVVLGGVLDSNWASTQDFESDEKLNELVKENEVFHFYSLQEKVTEEVVQETTLYVSEASGSTVFTAHFEPFQSENKVLIGISGQWNALPRGLEVLEDGQSYNVDIEGDGNIETIKVKNIKIDETSPRNETYSVDGIQVSLEKDNQNIPIIEIPIDGEYISDYSITALDLNGDEKLEILISMVGHGYSFVAYEFDDNKFNDVLSFYDGD